MVASRTLCALKDDFHLAQDTRKLFGLCSRGDKSARTRILGSARWRGGGTLDAPFGPSSLEMCSRACLGKSATVLDLALPNKKDMLGNGCADALSCEGSLSARSPVRVERRWLHVPLKIPRGGAQVKCW